MPKKDFSQVAFDVVRKATGEAPKQLPKPQKETAPKANKGAAKKPSHKTAAWSLSDFHCATGCCLNFSQF